MTATAITTELLEVAGFQREQIFGYVKRVGDTSIMLGTFPRNDMCVSVRFENVEATVITNAVSMEDLADLERLLGNAFIDYDHEEFIDDEDMEVDDDDSVDDETDNQRRARLCADRRESRRKY